MLNTWLNLCCLLELEIEIESILKSNEKSIQEEEKHFLSVQEQNSVMAASAQVTDFYSKSETKCLYQKRKQFI